MSKTRVITKIPKVITRYFNNKERKNYGYSDKDIQEIHLDKRVMKRFGAEIIIHEHLHCAFPDASEREITTIAGTIGDYLWEAGYRKVK
jgi:hypothetical protein